MLGRVWCLVHVTIKVDFFSVCRELTSSNERSSCMKGFNCQHIPCHPNISESIFYITIPEGFHTSSYMYNKKED